MKQLENYTKFDFDKDYFHYSGNNSYFVRATLLSEMKEFTYENNQIYHSINVSESIATEKLGNSNFLSDWNTNYWIFKFNNDIFYYQNDKYKGCTIGILCKKKDTTKNWLFEPEEYDYKKNIELGKKLLSFCEELSNKLK